MESIMQFIRNQKGISIGKLLILPNGVIRIYSASGALLGWYDPGIGHTVNAKTGNWMGFGDQTMLLLANTL
jgi:hypothetical protein